MKLNQDTRSLLAVGLSVGVFVLWYAFLSPKPPKPALQEVAAVTAQVAAPATTIPTQVAAAQSSLPAQTSTSASLVADPQATTPVKLSTFESELWKVVLTNDGAVPLSWEMKKYKEGKPPAEKQINLVSEANPPLLQKLSFTVIPERPRFTVHSESENEIVYVWQNNEVQITKTYRFDPNKYQLDLILGVKNLGKNPVQGTVSLDWKYQNGKQEKGGFLSFLKGPKNEHQPIFDINNKVEREAGVNKIGRLLWSGVEDRYFIAAIVPREASDAASVATQMIPSQDGGRIVGAVATEPLPAIIPGSEVVQTFALYVGPKQMESLKAVGANLDKAIDHGWFSVIALPILYLLKFFYGLVHNWGVAIILLTLFVKLLLHPLTKHSMKSMKAMQKIQPQMKALREKYKNDRERLNMETMQLFKTNKVNPMGGCLPMLLQFPIYIALYRVLWSSIELYRSPFFWFYRDLSAPDPTFVMPILLGVFMWLQQKFTPSASMDPQQAKMMQIMPIMFTAFMLFLPSGLVLYILVNTLTSVLQQWMSNNDIRFRDLMRGKFKKASA